jgi:hypothetical protein
MRRMRMRINKNNENPLARGLATPRRRSVYSLYGRKRDTKRSKNPVGGQCKYEQYKVSSNGYLFCMLLVIDVDV